MTARVAIYFTPPRGSRLAVFAASWLGRDVATAQDVPRCSIAGIDVAVHETITTSPRRYGFHATLKAPFELAAGCSLEDVHHALASLVAGRPQIKGPALKFGDLFGFLALTLAEPSPEIDRLAGECVEVVERFRAPLSEEDIARRREADLTPRQDELMQLWGYPYVFDEFLFHMTLTEHLAEAERQRVMAALAPHVSPFCETPLMVDGLSLVAQAERTAPFVVIDRFELRG